LKYPIAEKFCRSNVLLQDFDFGFTHNYNSAIYNQTINDVTSLWLQGVVVFAECNPMDIIRQCCPLHKGEENVCAKILSPATAPRIPIEIDGIVDETTAPRITIAGFPAIPVISSGGPEKKIRCLG
jgi:hypothetical protein